MSCAPAVDEERPRLQRRSRPVLAALIVAIGVAGVAELSGAAIGAAGERSVAPAVAEARESRERADTMAAELERRLDELSSRIAQTSASADAITADLTRSREALRLTAVKAFLNHGRDLELVAFLTSDELADASDRLTLLSAGAGAAADDVGAYQRLRDETSPALLRLADERGVLEREVADARDAALQARAMEAEAERAADEAEAAAARAALAEQAAAAARNAELQLQAAAAQSTPVVAPAAAAAPVPSASRSLDPAAVQVHPPSDLPPVPLGGPTEEQWARLRQCEATGNYRAISRSGRYRGAYQFDQRTWEGIGGRGDPAAASPAEQDVRAKILYSQRGWRPWPVCGRKLIS